MTFDANMNQQAQSLTTSDTKVELLAFTMKTCWPLLIPQTHKHPQDVCTG